MLPPKQFETARLFARIPRLDDAEPVFEAYGQDPEVTRYLIWKPYTDVEPLRDFFLNCIRNWAANVSYPYMLCLKGTDVPIGSIHMNIDNFSAGFGYVLAKPYWGQGLIPEALSYLVDWSLTQSEIYRAWAFCDVENPASMRVMEKAGMTREGILRRWHICPTINKEPRDCFVLSKVKE